MQKTRVVPLGTNPAAQAKARFVKAVSQLKEYGEQVNRGEEAKRKAVQVVEDYLKTVERGKRNDTRNALIQQARIGHGTFFRWKSEVAEFNALGQDVITEVTRQGYVLNTPLRKALLDVKQKKPNAPAQKVVEAARELVSTPRVCAPRKPVEELRVALAEFLDDGTPSDLLEALKAMNIPRDEICDALKGFCK